MVNGMRNVWVRYDFVSWSLLGEPSVSGMGHRVCRVDEMYGETVEDAMRRTATFLRRDRKELERMEITCTAEGKTEVFKFNM